MLEFNGRVAVITGAARGIGRALALAFASEGMRIVAVDLDDDGLRNLRDEITLQGSECMTAIADVTDLKVMEELASRVGRDFGEVHVLCNNAGVAALGRVWEISPETWEWVMDVNLRGVFNGIRAFLPGMIRHKKAGHVVNMASIAGVTADAWIGAYAASKHAVVGLSESLRQDLLQVGSEIGVSVVCPGYTRTEILRNVRMPESADAVVAGEFETQMKERVASGIPPETVAIAVMLAMREKQFLVLTDPNAAAQVRARVEKWLEPLPSRNGGARCPFGSHTPSTTNGQRLPVFDPAKLAQGDDLYEYYKRYREQEPIHWRPDVRGGGRWTLFRHVDIVSALGNDAMGREAGSAPPATPQSPFMETARRWMIFRDNPDHVVIRGAFAKTFCPAGMKSMLQRIEEMTVAMIKDLPESGPIDLIESFASLVPMRVIASLLGLPECHESKLRQWSNNLAAAIDTGPTPEVLRNADETVVEVTQVLGDILEERRRNPADDMITRLSQFAEETGKPNSPELLANCLFMLVAGYETTTNLISSGMLMLLQNPALREQFQSNPGLVDSAVEEFLRFESPVQITTRIVKRDLEFCGVKFLKGQHLETILGSANRDAAVFTNPEQVDITRKPNPHLAFGSGPHSCMGSGLARTEARIALRLLNTHHPNMQFAGGEPEWRRTVNFRGLKHLPVTL